MSNIASLPTSITAFFAAVKTGSVDAVLACFSPTASITDEGYTMTSHYILRSWIAGNLLPPKPVFTPKSSRQLGTQYIVSVAISGGYDFAALKLSDPFTLDFHFTPAAASGPLLDALTIVEPGSGTMLSAHATHGSPDAPLAALAVAPLPVPLVPAGWVRIRVTAASLNWHDVWTLWGRSHPGLTFPRTLGCDGAGTLEDGTRVAIYGTMGAADFKGDETIDPARHFLTDITDGTLAEYVTVPARNAVPIPAAVPDETAAVLGVAWLTAYRMLFVKSRLRPGQVMLVQGCSGGVATALVQLGSAAGFRVWATGRSGEKRKMAEELGAERTFEAGAELPQLVDAVFDLAGIKTWEHSLRCVRTGGVLVGCGFHTGQGTLGVPLDLWKAVADQVDVRGVYDGTLEEFKDLISFVAAKGIKPRIAKVLTLQEVGEGMQDLIEGTTSGKIVVKM